MYASTVDETEGTETPEAALSFSNVGLWHVLRVRSRQERILAAEVESLGISCFLPAARVLRRYGTEQLLVEVPLFPGYLFVRGSMEDARTASRSERVTEIISVRDQAQINWELRNLAIAVAADVTLEPAFHLASGVRAEVRSGPLCGMQGLIDDRNGPDRLVLQVDLIEQAVSIRADAAPLDVVQ